MNTPPIKIYDFSKDIDQGLKEEKKEENEIKEKTTNPLVCLKYSDPRLDNPSNTLIEEYLENINPRCELAERLDAFYDENGLILTQ